MKDQADLMEQELLKMPDTEQKRRAMKEKAGFRSGTHPPISGEGIAVLILHNKFAHLITSGRCKAQ